jgi:integrase
MVEKRDLTDRALRALRPAPAGKRVIVWDACVPQFGIRISDKSTKNVVGVFVLVARWPGSTNPAPRAIGSYPAMTLAKAREIARSWREDIRQGVDPKAKEEQRRREEEKRRADTVQAAFSAFAAEHLARLRTGEEVKKTFARHVLPTWGARPVREIRRADVKGLVCKVHADAPIASNRVLAAVKTFLGWCAQEELIEASPAASVKPLAAETKRDRVLSDLEIRAIWQACEELGVFGRYFRFLLATGARRSEAAAATWSELDLGQRLWTLPQSRSKNKRQHVLPLNSVAIDILGECPRAGEHVFTTNNKTAICGWSKAKATLDRLAGERLQALAADRGEEQPAQIAEWHLHDCRRTFATNLAQLRVDRETVRELLNHSDASVTATYDRWRRQPEKIAAMDAWGRRLQSIVNGTADNVVSLTAARG